MTIPGFCLLPGRPLAEQHAQVYAQKLISRPHSCNGLIRLVVSTNSIYYIYIICVCVCVCVCVANRIFHRIPDVKISFGDNIL